MDDIFCYPETRIKVAIIDTGLRPERRFMPFLCSGNEHISLVSENYNFDPIGHGTSVAGLIIENLDPKTHCIVMIKFMGQSGNGNVTKNIIDGIKYATKIGARYLNLSLGGSESSKEELEALQAAIKSGMHISAASGNDSGKGPVRNAKGHVIFKRDFLGKLILRKNSHGKPVCRVIKKKRICFHELVEEEMGADLDKKCIYFPACYPLDEAHFHVVGSSTGRKNSYGGTHIYGNYGKVVKYLEDGTNKGDPSMVGTSMSTAIHTGKWASGKVP